MFILAESVKYLVDPCPNFSSLTNLSLTDEDAGKFVCQSIIFRTAVFIFNLRTDLSFIVITIQSLFIKFRK